MTTGDRPLHDVAKDLRKHGFSIDQVLDELQMITGSAADDVAEKARSVKGVSNVSMNPGAHTL